MEQLRNALRSLTLVVCRQFDGVQIPTRPTWTVVSSPDAAPYIAMDFSRPALSELRFNLSIGLLQLPEYGTAAEVVENDPELREGIMVDAGGSLLEPERTNVTRGLLSNFLWRYLREGTQRDWDETRFNETFDELLGQLRHKSVIFHTTLPLSNLKMDVAELDFGEELTLLPASMEELERWINPDQDLAPLGVGRPQWAPYYVDKPGVLHAHPEVEGRPRSTDLQAMFGQLPRFNVDHAITALRLVLKAPISVMFQENHSEGLMAFGGGGTFSGWPLPQFFLVATLNEEKAAQVRHIWQRLQTSPNVELLRLPLRRWEASLLRSNHEDRLVDAWIGLESLLIRGNGGELKFRAAMRLAEFLGIGGVQRREIYRYARISYDWRSVIAHGSSSKAVAKRMPFQQALDVTTDYLRSALLKVLELPGGFDPDKLESDLLSR